MILLNWYKEEANGLNIYGFYNRCCALGEGVGLAICEFFRKIFVKLFIVIYKIVTFVV